MNIADELILCIVSMVASVKGRASVLLKAGYT